MTEPLTVRVNVYENARGERRYQPALSSGLCLWTPWYDGSRRWVWSRSVTGSHSAPYVRPVLFRSERIAALVARREVRLRVKGAADAERHAVERFLPVDVPEVGTAEDAKQDHIWSVLEEKVEDGIVNLDLNNPADNETFQQLVHELSFLELVGQSRHPDRSDS